MKIGILGGSFNPAHEGHIKISLEAIDLLGLDKIYWLITKQNPLKSNNEYLPFNLRIESANKIIKTNNIEVIDTENYTNSNYIIDNLRYLKSKNNKDNFIFLMGADSFISLYKWKDYENIIEEFPIAVFNRNGLEDKVINGFIGKKYEKYRLNFDSRRLWYKKNQNWIFIKNFDENISSTEIRLKK